MVEDLKPFRAAKRTCFCAEDLEVVEDIRLNAFQPRPRGSQVLRLDPEGDVLRFHHPVVPLRKLALQHGAIFFTDPVKSVVVVRDVDPFLVLRYIHLLVEEAELHTDVGIKVIQEIAVILEDHCLVLRQRKEIIDIVELYGLREKCLRHLAHPVPVHAEIGDALLCRLGYISPSPSGIFLIFPFSSISSAQLPPAFFLSRRAGLCLSSFCLFCHRLPPSTTKHRLHRNSLSCTA